MARKCDEKISMSSVDMACSTTKCSLAKADTAHHITDIINNRPGSIYGVEICSVTLNGLVDFNGSPKSITKYGIIGSKATAPTTSINLNPLSGPGTEEIQTTVEFYDATQRVGNNMFLGQKESYPVDYEMDLL